VNKTWPTRMWTRATDDSKGSAEAESDRRRGGLNREPQGNSKFTDEGGQERGRECVYAEFNSTGGTPKPISKAGGIQRLNFEEKTPNKQL